MKKLFIIALLLLAIGGGTTFGTWVGKSNIFPAHNSMEKGQTLSIEDSKVSPGIPRTLLIPSINVQAPVESVGMDGQGRMDVPRTADDAGWYNLGYKPGDKGSAVLDGHFDRATGAPAIFYSLKNIHLGDAIKVTDDKNHTFTFKVTKVINYPYNNVPLQEVFGQQGKPMLNLITCEGTWNKNTKNYSHRTVVYSEMIQ